MKKQIEEILFINNKFIRNRFRDDFFKKNHPILYNLIIRSISDEYTFKEKVYILYMNIENPVCCVCGNKTNLISFSKGFTRYCSKQCIQKDEDVKNKVKETNFKKFGTDHPLKSDEIKNKIKETNLKKYGVDCVLKSNDVLEKIKQTNILKYGFENPFQSDEIKNKIKETNLNKYGVEHNSNCIEIVDKRKSTFLKRYGVDNPNKSPNIINKRNHTNQIKYIEKYAELLNISINNIELLNDGDVKISNFCKKHKSFKINKQNLFNRLKYGISDICTKCNPISESTRIKENEIINFISELNVNYDRNNRKILKNRELDIYLPDNKLGIEFDGLYWHSNKYQDSKYHLNKTENCNLLNIQLIHIFEDEWINKKEIVKSIIKSKLGLFNNRIYGRNCEIKEIIDNDLVKNFLNNNHLQGFVGGSVKLGLFYNNELVSLMTFGNKRKSLGSKSNENEYEMLRFCNKLDTQVIGGASKLLKYFIKNYNPKSITTFADRRYSNGELYNKLGFKFIRNTEPNYWYFKSHEYILHHRFSFRKDVLVKEGFDINKTEKEIMGERGYYHIYDCGNMKFELNCLK